MYFLKLFYDIVYWWLNDICFRHVSLSIATNYLSFSFFCQPLFHLNQCFSKSFHSPSSTLANAKLFLFIVFNYCPITLCQLGIFQQLIHFSNFPHSLSSTLTNAKSFLLNKMDSKEELLHHSTSSPLFNYFPEEDRLRVDRLQSLIQVGKEQKVHPAARALIAATSSARYVLTNIHTLLLVTNQWENSKLKYVECIDSA